MRRLCAGIILVAALAATSTTSADAGRSSLSSKPLTLSVALVASNPNTFALTAKYSGSTPSGRFFVSFIAIDDKIKTLQPSSVKAPGIKVWRNPGDDHTMVASGGVGPNGKLVILIKYAGSRSVKMCFGVATGWLVKNPNASNTISDHLVCTYK